MPPKKTSPAAGSPATTLPVAMSPVITVELPANLTISTAEALHEKWEPLLLGDGDVSIDGANVERTDTAGLQLLLAFKDALQKRNLSFTWQSSSSVLIEAADQIGMGKLLELKSSQAKEDRQ